MLKRLFMLFIAALMILPMGVYADNDETKIYYYVSPDGNDANNGTQNSPFKTIERAKAAVRELKKTGLPDGEVVVYLRGGIYTASETLKFGAEDSGTETCTITYAAYPGEQPVISAGSYVDADAFGNVSDKEVMSRLSIGGKKNVKAIDLKKLGITDYGKLTQAGDNVQSTDDEIYGMQVYVGDKAYDLARWPNRDAEGFSRYVKTGTIITEHNGYTVGKNADVISTFYVDDNVEKRILSWKNTDDVWTEGSFDWVYFSTSLPVASYDKNKNVLGLRGGVYGGFDDDKPFYFFNVLEELDTPGEYYIDREKGILYIYPDDNFKNGEKVKLSCKGGYYIMEVTDASYINFSGIDFELNRFHGANIDHSSFINVTDCEFVNCGGFGLIVGEVQGYAHSSRRAREYISDEDIGVETHDINVISCKFSNTGCGGLRIAAGNLATLTPGNINVINCYASRTDISNKTYAPGIGAFGSGNIVKNNHIENLSHAAINWAGSEIILANNELNNCLLEYADMGVIYTSWSAYTSEIKNNYIHDIPMGEMHQSAGYGEYHRMLDTNQFMEHKVGMYFDGHSNGGKVYNNVIEDVSYGIHAKGWDTTVDSNIFFDVYFPFQISGSAFARDAVNAGKEWYEGQNTTYYKLLLGKSNNGEVPEKWREKYPDVIALAESIDKNFKEKELNTAILSREHLNNNLVVYRDKLDFMDLYGRFGDLNLFNNFTKNSRTSYMETKDTSIKNNYPNGGTFENNKVVNCDIGFVDFANDDLTLKEDSDILKTHPNLAGIKMDEIGTVTENLDKLISDKAVFMSGSPKAIVNGKAGILDSGNVENEAVSKNGEVYINAGFAKASFGVEIDGAEISLKELAAKTGKKLYSDENGLCVLYSGDTCFPDTEYGITLTEVLSARMK